MKQIILLASMLLPGVCRADDPQAVLPPREALRQRWWPERMSDTATHVAQIVNTKSKAVWVSGWGARVLTVTWTADSKRYALAEMVRTPKGKLVPKPLGKFATMTDAENAIETIYRDSHGPVPARQPALRIGIQPQRK